jgi:glycosyltransferase involved in cell wall biosynthesis
VQKIDTIVQRPHGTISKRKKIYEDLHLNYDDSSRHVMFLLSTLAVGGSERKTVRIANALAARGWKLTIGYLNAPHTLRNDISGDVNVVFLDRKGKYDFGALRRLVAYVSQYNIDMICCINLYPLIYAYPAKYFVSVASLGILATINTTEFTARKDAWQMLLYAPILRRAHAVIFGCQYQMELWVSRYGLREAECSFIYNGVDAEFFDPLKLYGLPLDIRSELEIPSTSLVVGSIGRFREEKQYEMVIDACVELRKKKGLDVYCLLVGGGKEKQRLEDLVNELNCAQYVRLLDEVKDVRPYLDAMDVFVLSSISETFSNAVLEALSMGIPVVLPKVGGCPEMVKPNITGFIFEPGDKLQLVEYLYVLGSDGELRAKMGQAARQYVIEKFQSRSMFESYELMLSGPLSA